MKTLMSLFTFSFHSNMTSTNIKVDNMLKPNDIWENLENLVKQV